MWLRKTNFFLMYKHKLDSFNIFEMYNMEYNSIINNHVQLMIIYKYKYDKALSMFNIA